MLPFPPLREQKAIARILGVLDDKIELNRRMNDTLETLARALFKSWFVDFDPVVAKAAGKQPVGMSAKTAALFPAPVSRNHQLGPIPKGWKLGSVAEIAAYFVQRSELHNDRDRNRPQWSSRIAERISGSAGCDSLTTTPLRTAKTPRTSVTFVVRSGPVRWTFTVWHGDVSACESAIFQGASAKQHPQWFVHLLDLQDGDAAHFRHRGRQRDDDGPTSNASISVPIPKSLVPPDSVWRAAERVCSTQSTNVIHHAERQ